MSASYTIQEIDQLRRLCRDKIIWGAYLPNWEIPRSSGSYREEEVFKKTEEMVRTFMLAGTRPEDFVKASEETK